MRTAFLAAICLSAAVTPAAQAQDYGQGPYTYYLHPPSSYQQGCWGPCACPLTNHEAMSGTFTLALITVGNLTDFYAISDVSWTVPTVGGQAFNLSLAGSGTFAAGQVPFATHQNMSLDLTLTPPAPPWAVLQQFATTPAAGTRTVPPPVIDIEVANSTGGCPGIRLRVVASRCRCDWNASGSVTVADIFDFLAGWFAGNPAADFNGDGSENVQDIFDFLGAWFAGCP